MMKAINGAAAAAKMLQSSQHQSQLALCTGSTVASVCTSAEEIVNYPEEEGTTLVEVNEKFELWQLEVAKLTKMAQIISSDATLLEAQQVEVKVAWEAYLETKNRVRKSQIQQLRPGTALNSLGEAAEFDIVVHQLCSLHSARNANLTSELAKKLCTKAAVAPTESARDYYMKQLFDHFPKNQVEDFFSRALEWSTVAMLALGMKTNLGETNQNSSEVLHHADNFLRYVPIAEGVIQF